MLSIIIKRDKDPNVNLLTELQMTKYLWQIPEGGEVLLEDSWQQGLKKVSTPFVCLVEPDCVLSGSYITSNYGLMKKTEGKLGQGGGYNKLAMLSSPVGVKEFSNRIFNYKLLKIISDRNNDDTFEIRTWHIQPFKEKRDMKIYNVQVGFVPGAIMRTSSLDKELIEDIDWDQPDMVKLSAEVSFYLWNTNRRVAINPNTTYVTNDERVGRPPLFTVDIPDRVGNLFVREGF